MENTLIDKTPQPKTLSGERKRSFIQRLFSDIAPRYDWFNRLVSFGMDQDWRRFALEKGNVTAGLSVLDVCAGTGDLALLCASRVGAQGRIIGLDLNHEMLLEAHRKHSAGGAISGWVQAPAEVLPFETGEFDRVTIGFSTRNLTDLQTGLAEMLRVLKPGGKLIILETGRPANPLVRFGYFLFLFTIARLIGFILTGKIWPFTYLARSVRHFITPPEMVAFLERLGSEVDFYPLSGGLASLFVATKQMKTKNEF